MTLLMQRLLGIIAFGVLLLSLPAFSDESHLGLQNRLEISGLLQQISRSSESNVSPNTLRWAARQMEQETLEYLTALGVNFSTSRTPERDLRIKISGMTPEKSWLNRIAARLRSEGQTLSIQPSLLEKRHFGVYLQQQNDVILAVIPFPEIFGGVFAHEIFHFVIINSVAGKNLPHFQRGELIRGAKTAGSTASAATDNDDEPYKNFHFSELGAVAEELLALKGNPLHHAEQQARLFQLPSSNFRTPLTFFAVDISQALRKGAYIKIARTSSDTSYRLLLIDNDKNVLQLEAFMSFEELDLPAPHSREPFSNNEILSYWNYSDLPSADQNFIRIRLLYYRSLVEEFIAEMDNLPGEALNNIAGLASIADLPHKKLQELNQRWLDELGLPGDHPARTLEASYRPLLDCAKEECPALPPTPPCDRLLID